MKRMIIPSKLRLTQYWDTVVFAAALSAVIFQCFQGVAYAQNSGSELNLRQRGIIFIDPDSIIGSGGCAVSGAGGPAVPSSVGLSGPIVEAINKNKGVYDAVSAELDVPWQMVAAIHFKETGLSSEANPELSGEGYYEGLYQLHTLVVIEDINDDGSENHSFDGSSMFPPGPITQEEFRRQTVLAVKFLLGKQASNSTPATQQKITNSNPNPDAIKDTFFGYNGRSSFYASQAAVYGFDPVTQPYEGSAYVMNNFDAARTGMPRIPSLGGTETTDGAFTFYSKLAGIAGGTGGCSGTSQNGSAGKIVEIAVAELNKNVAEEPRGSNCGPEVEKYTDGSCEYWCADFVSWVYQQAGKPFTGGWSGGWRISYVPNMYAWLVANGQFTMRTENSFAPQPGDVITFKDSEGDNGHVGLVYRLEGTTLITIEGNTSDELGQREYTDYTNNNRITGWGRMK